MLRRFQTTAFIFFVFVQTWPIFEGTFPRTFVQVQVWTICTEPPQLFIMLCGLVDEWALGGAKHQFMCPECGVFHYRHIGSQEYHRSPMAKRNVAYAPTPEFVSYFLFRTTDRTTYTVHSIPLHLQDGSNSHLFQKLNMSYAFFCL